MVDYEFSGTFSNVGEYYKVSFYCDNFDELMALIEYAKQINNHGLTTIYADDRPLYTKPRRPDEN